MVLEEERVVVMDGEGEVEEVVVVGKRAVVAVIRVVGM
jgi:hypothetical protein